MTPIPSNDQDAIENLFGERDAMLVIEAIIFAAANPITEADLSPFVPANQKLSDIIRAIQTEIASRPYELQLIAGGWAFRTRPNVAAAIRSYIGTNRQSNPKLSNQDMIILASVAYGQPITRVQISAQINKNVSREALGRLKRTGLLDSGPRAPEPGAPVTYVTTVKFLQMFSLESLADLPDPDLREPAADDSLDIPLPNDNFGEENDGDD